MFCLPLFPPLAQKRTQILINSPSEKMFIIYILLTLQNVKKEHSNYPNVA